MIEVQLQFFGELRKYESVCVPLSLELQAPLTVENIKVELANRLRSAVAGFSDDQLIRDSAVADQTGILLPGYVVSGPCRLLLLPPVCGG